ncbi:plasmid pRiA4b ORF-3 family protein [Delftia sp. ZNC0008]|uniref:plasmid pRiA4b ORF-3 family protein n=1 Tax=Delftia sp. ZNC0008 TaxID=1339242 RepID=UPI000648CF1F|nr:plasmid pRiA4b ORF-3 family protein [Delftia sp. ZNC0008]
MSTKSPARRSTPLCIYQLRIELQHIKPTIRRCILVPGSITLAKLDRVIQAAMGWENSHLHEFRIEEKRYGTPDPEWTEPDVLNERKYKLGDLLGETVQQFSYSYDFGDGWEHSVVVEQRLAAIEDKNTWPMCISGQNACPPEDVGGPDGYMDFLEAIHNPDHERHEDLWMWWGGPFDAQGFSLNDTNKAIFKLR